MFCGFRSKFVFFETFFDFGCHLGVHLAPNLRKKPFRKSLQKIGAPSTQTGPYDHGPRLPDIPPRMRAFSTRNKSSSKNCRNCCSNSIFLVNLFHFVSFSFCLGNMFHFFGEICFHFCKIVRQNRIEKVNVKST